MTNKDFWNNMKHKPFVYEKDNGVLRAIGIKNNKVILAEPYRRPEYENRHIQNRTKKRHWLNAGMTKQEAMTKYPEYFI